MAISCDIEFDNNPEGIYLVGREISGRIILRADKAKQVEGNFYWWFSCCLNGITIDVSVFYNMSPFQEL